MADLSEFLLTVNLELLNTLRFGLSQLPGAAQRADQAIQAAITQAAEAAKAKEALDPAEIERREVKAQVKNMHSNGHA